MKLTTQAAREFYAKIETLGSDNRSFEDKMIGKDGLSYIFRTIVYKLTTQADRSIGIIERIGTILKNTDMNPGPDLSNKVERLCKDLNKYIKKFVSPTEADFKRCAKVLAEFLAFYSETVIPDSVKAVYESSSTASTPQDSKPMELEFDDLIDNPTTRVPVVLCLDISGSMMGEKIKELNVGVKQFFNAILNDEIAKYAADICIVTFSTTANIVMDFASIEKQISSISNLELKASGNTAMGTAVNMSLDTLERRKKEYIEKGIDYWQPWLVLMTDGQPTENIDNATERTAQLLKANKLTVFPIGIGDGASMEHLRRFSTPDRPPLKLKGLMLSEFFNWLGKSVQCTSQSTPGTSVKLPPIGWAEIS